MLANLITAFLVIALVVSLILACSTVIGILRLELMLYTLVIINIAKQFISIQKRLFYCLKFAFCFFCVKFPFQSYSNSIFYNINRCYIGQLMFMYSKKIAIKHSLFKQGQLKRNQFKKDQLGFSLIEVMVALFILVTGIIGAVAMQATAKQGSFDAMQRSLASSLTQDIIERIRNNDVTVATNVIASYANTNYGGLGLAVPSKRCDSLASLCTSAERVVNDQYEWEQSLIGANVKSSTNKNVGGLIGARGCIIVANHAVTVAVSWQGRRNTADGANGGVTCGTSGSKRRQIVVQAFTF